MLSLLAQRTAWRVPTVLCASRVPLITLTRTFATTPRTAYPGAASATKKVTATAKAKPTKKDSAVKKGVKKVAKTKTKAKGTKGTKGE